MIVCPYCGQSTWVDEACVLPGCWGHPDNEPLLDRDRKPPRVEGMANHQVWVWLNGAEPPHWEIRGTGVVI